jgi:hypothetical protein
VMRRILRVLPKHLPWDGVLIRGRVNSSKLSLYYRAAEGTPTKREIVGVDTNEEGKKDKIEILGDGQQSVVHGIHPSGVRYEWRGGRSPATVPLDQLPVVTEQQITAFLVECAPIIGSPGEGRQATKVVDLFPKKSAAEIAAVMASPDNMSGGIEPLPFERLSADEKRTCLKYWLDKLDNRTNDPRERWRDILWAAADAERLGCPDARQIALEWSKRGAGWESEEKFDGVWNSYQPNGKNIGTLIKAVRDAGFDPWRPSRARPEGME